MCGRTVASAITLLRAARVPAGESSLRVAFGPTHLGRRAVDGPVVRTAPAAHGRSALSRRRRRTPGRDVGFAAATSCSGVAGVPSRTPLPPRPPRHGPARGTQASPMYQSRLALPRRPATRAPAARSPLARGAPVAPVASVHAPRRPQGPSPLSERPPRASPRPSPATVTGRRARVRAKTVGTAGAAAGPWLARMATPGRRAMRSRAPDPLPAHGKHLRAYRAARGTRRRRVAPALARALPRTPLGGRAAAGGGRGRSR